MKKIISVFALTIVFAAQAFADISMPETAPTRTPQTDVQLKIFLSNSEKQARLVIPRDHLKDVLAATAQTSGANDSALGISRMQTAVGGFFLSLAFMAGGVWLARFRKVGTRAGKTVAFGVVIFLAGVFATVTFGNVAPPPLEARRITSLIFDKTALKRGTAYGDVKLQIEEGGGSVYLFVPIVEDDKKNEEE